jgi:hypothetical protein
MLGQSMSIGVVAGRGWLIQGMDGGKDRRSGGVATGAIDPAASVEVRTASLLQSFDAGASFARIGRAALPVPPTVVGERRVAFASFSSRHGGGPGQD